MTIRTRLMSGYLILTMLVAVSGFFGWFAARDMLSSFEGSEERVHAIVATATDLSLHAKRLQTHLIWYLTFHNESQKQKLMDISSAIKEHVMDLDSVIKIPKAKEVAKEASKEAAALLSSVDKLIESHDRQYGDTGSFDISQYAGSLLDVSDLSSKLRSHGVKLAEIETDYLDRQEGIIAATKSMSFAQRAEGHLLLFLTLGDEVDRTKFYQRLSSLKQEIEVLEDRVVTSDGERLVSELKAHEKELFFAGDALVHAYDDAMTGKKRFILSHHSELLQDLRNATHQIDTIAMALAQMKLESEIRPKKVALAYAESLQHRILMVALTAIIVALMLGYWISRGILRPVTELTRAAREIGNGELGIRLAVPAGDEIGELVNTFNRMSEDLLRTTVRKDYVENIFTCMAEALIVTSAEGLVKRVNKSATDLLGYSEEELLDRPIESIVFDGLGNRLAHMAHEMGSCSKGEITLLAKSGQLVPAICSISQFAGSNGCVQGIVITAQDISELKRAQQELKTAHDELELRVQERTTELEIAKETITAERQKLFDILETMPVMVILLTPDYHVLFANRSFREIFGDHEGRRCFEYCFGLEAPCEFCETCNVLKTNEPHHGERVTAGGSIIDTYAFPFTDGNGAPLILKIGIDITVQRQTEKDLEKTLNDLVRSNADLEQFAYIASHDLQEPVRSVSNALQMLEKEHKGKLGQDSDLLIHFAIEQSRRMQALIQDLLKYSRIQSRGQTFTMVDTQEVLKHSILNLERLIGERGTKVTHSEMPTVFGDSTQLLQVFQNLIGNAIKFGREESPHIHVSAERGPREWSFSVQDNGIGIEAEYFDRIFEVFQQLNRTDTFTGTGIGLAIVKKIVERHGGRVWVESELGEGAIFRFTIPNGKQDES
ncbi:ATP-binding protein [Desulfomonile tiedjei]|uniref:histidine kinase n=1 Tax=Desulfomonile tiedjei (strain ATCC 49306 / DSM 6799 / DCB-1) TaxID=706587 RepID=I4C5C7_DESTA|nr:ATP-binding protein [Desulfomonile tiedjei]AFM24768.1 PAS domain S-box [Desulfomonile tiedjei DSM 6799]